MLTAEQLNQQGVDACLAGRPAEAIALLEQAVARQPAQPVFHANLALAHVRNGQPEQALPHYCAALELRPAHAPTLAKLGRAFAACGRTGPALDALRAAVDIASADSDHWNALAAVQAAAGQLDAARTNLERALALDPAFDEALANLLAVLDRLAAAAAASHDWTAAAQHTNRALQLDPHSPDRLFQLALASTALGHLDRAQQAYERALQLRPHHPETLNNLAHVVLARGDPARALACLRVVLQANPDYRDAWYNLGVTLQELGEYDEARDAYHQVLRLDPAHADARNNLGGMHLAEARPREAIAEFDRALAADSRHAEARWNRGLAHLSLAEWEPGWRDYEARFRQKDRPPREFPIPPWQGEDLTGKSLLVWAEQGLGDTIQFARFVPEVAARAARVALECQPRLTPLLAATPLDTEVLPRGAALPAADLHVPLMSLPGLLAVRPETVPPPIPPHLPPERLRHWQTELANLPGRKIGICWAGHPDHRKGRNRSIPLALLSRLANTPGVTLVSLQRGPQSAELDALPGSEAILRLEDDNGGLANSAALIRALDLVVTVDTMVAHLAGTLGRPVWTLLPCAADWRWMIARDDTPWYPTMRLWRQRRRGDWEELITRLAAALQT